MNIPYSEIEGIVSNSPGAFKKYDEELSSQLSRDTWIVEKILTRRYQKLLKVESILMNPKVFDKLIEEAKHFIELIQHDNGSYTHDGIPIEKSNETIKWDFKITP